MSSPLARAAKRGFVVALFLSPAFLPLSLGHGLAWADGPAAGPSVVVRALGPLAAPFVPNGGQTDPAVRFEVHGLGGTLFFTPSEVVLGLPRSARAGQSPRTALNLPAAGDGGAGVPVTYLRLRFAGANTAPEIAGLEPLPGVVSYFKGADPSRWATRLPTFAGIAYRDLYPGIGLRYEAWEGSLKGTFLVAPGADPSRIRWRYEGVAAAKVDGAGNLRMELPPVEKPGRPDPQPAAEVTEGAPVAWQDIDGVRRPVAARYQVASDGSIGFALPAGYDRAQPLVLDPTLTYSTYLGGSGEDNGYGIATDASGNVYLTGYTLSTNFPTQGGTDPGCGTDGNCDGFAFYDAFVTKLNPSVSGAAQLVFSSYLGGSANDYGLSVAVDGAGASYLAGHARQAFPTTGNAYQSTYGGAPGADAFLTKLSTDGSQLLYSSYLGGSGGDGAFGLAIDGAGVAYLAGRTYSTNFPTSAGALDASCGTDGLCNSSFSDVFVAKLNTLASGAASLLYSSYLGGSGDDVGYGVARDASNNYYVTGRTTSTDFPLAGTPFQATNGGGSDAFLLELNAAGSALLYSTYLGGPLYEDGFGIARSAAGFVYMVGTTSSSSFPTTPNAFQPAFGGVYDAYVARFDPAAAGAASLLYSSFLGGNDDDQGYGLAVDGSGYAYLAGFAFSTDLPTAGGPFQPVNAGTWDAFVAKVNPAASGAASLLYSTYLGGLSTDAAYSLALDGAGNILAAGQTYSSADFPKVNAYQPVHGGGTDVAVFRIDNATTSGDLGVSQVASPDPVSVGQNWSLAVTVTNTGPDAAPGVRLSEAMLETWALVFVSATPSQGSCSGTVSDVSCELGTLASGAGATVSIVVQPTFAVSLTATARVASTISDPSGLNNVASVTTTVLVDRIFADGFE